jgi:hypothetical protein
VAEGHESHDLASMVAFADGELTGADLEAAENQVRTCPSCAGLVDDLRLLSVADRTLATPPRPRDFRLTPADADRLRNAGSEPLVLPTRLVTKMTTTPDAHRTHDPELIAAAADGTLTGPDASRADEWLATCTACADLRRDLVAIAAANRTMATPARSRDFQLSQADAERLRGFGWRGFLARIGTSRDGFSRPLAVGLTTLGLAGLLISGGPSLLSGMGSGASSQTLTTVGAPITEGQGTDDVTRSVATDDDGVFSGEGEAAPSAAASAAAAPVTAQASEAPAAAPSAAPAAAGPDTLGPIPTADRLSDTSNGAGTGAGPSTTEAAPAASAASGSLDAAALKASETEAPPWPLLLSAASLVVGLGLFATRWLVRRARHA